MDSSESDSESDDDTATPENGDGPSSPPRQNGIADDKEQNGYKYVSVVNVNPPDGGEDAAVRHNGDLSDSDGETGDTDQPCQSVTVINVQDGSKDNDIVQFLDKETDNVTIQCKFFSSYFLIVYQF